MELCGTRSFVPVTFGFLNPIPACSSSAWVFSLSLFLTQVCFIYFFFLFFLITSLSSCHLCWLPAHQHGACLSSEEVVLEHALPSLSSSVSHGILPGWNWLPCVSGDAAAPCHVASVSSSPSHGHCRQGCPGLCVPRSAMPVCLRASTNTLFVAS